jgi:hypothetical protein
MLESCFHHWIYRTARTAGSTEPAELEKLPPDCNKYTLRGRFGDFVRDLFEDEGVPFTWSWRSPHGKEAAPNNNRSIGVLDNLDRFPASLECLHQCHRDSFTAIIFTVTTLEEFIALLSLSLVFWPAQAFQKPFKTYHKG